MHRLLLLLLVVGFSGCVASRDGVTTANPPLLPAPSSKPRAAAPPPLPPLAKSLTKSNTNEYPGTVGLVWKYSPSSNVSGYFVLQGTNSRTYNVKLDVGMADKITEWESCICPTNAVRSTGCAKIYNLAIGQKYYFTVVAYSSFGDESPQSNEVDYTYYPKTNVSLLVNILMPPSWTVYTNLPSMTNPVGSSYFRTVSTNGTVRVEAGKSPTGPWSSRLEFEHSNPLWKLDIKRTHY